MNILLLCGNLSYAGAQRQLLELAKGLNTNHNLIVCSISSNVPLLSEFTNNYIRVKVLNLRKRNFIRIVLELKKIIKNNNVQVVYSFLEMANTYSKIVKMISPNLKIISSERSSDIITNIAQRNTEIFFSYLTDLYIANSYAGKRALYDNYKVNNVKVIHNGVDIKRFHSLQESSLNEVQLENKTIIVQVGRIKPDKNFEMFLKVAELTCELHKNAIFIAIGDQPNSGNLYQDSILKEKAKLKYQDRILFIGARSDIPEILSKIDISILTSHREGCSNTILESMFAKCPLVVTDVGDNRIMLSKVNQDYIVKPNSVEEMVKKISTLISNPDLRKTIGINNYNKALKKFTKEVMVQNTESIILELLNKK